MIPGYLSPLVNHLWQSTLFAVIAGLVTLLLRKNRAAVRYRLWLAASVKFLVPFSWLVAIGSQFQWRTAPVAVSTGFSVAMEQVFAPQAFAAAATAPPAAPTVTFISLPVLLLAIWALGVATVLLGWWRQWRPIRTALKHATPLGLDATSLTTEITVMSSPHPLEPGIVGIRRPVLLLPEGIADRLQPSQLDAIVVHELCHVRRRDNLAAVVHMVVEALYWFHPVVWWIETRLVDERERACDEEVLQKGSSPQIYAEGILNVCRFYAESPMVCASGVTGSDLKRRIEAIMRNYAGLALSFWKRLLLVTIAVFAVTTPMVVGVLNAPLRAQSQPAVSGPAASFEVVSIKPNKSADFRSRQATEPGGRFTATNVTLRFLIQGAYGRLQDFQVSGGPNWLDTEHFDVAAKAEGNPTPEQFSVMLRALLAERFKLVLHTETRDLPVYALTMSGRDRRPGPQLRSGTSDCKGLRPNAPVAPQPASCGLHFAPGGRLAARGVTMGQLAQSLSREVNRAVLDRTGLAGEFDMDLRWTPAPGEFQFGLPPEASGASDPPADSAPSIYTALREQLGLKLELAKGPVDVLVIDHVEQPTDNQAGDFSPPSAPQAHPTPQNLAADWRLDETDHFSVSYAVSISSQIDQMKREVERAYNTVSAELRHDVPFRPVLVVFSTRAELERGSSASRLVATLGALPPADKRVLIAVDMPAGQRSADLVRQLRVIFDQDIAGSKLRAQASAVGIAGAPTFEVASLKPNKSGLPRGQDAAIELGGLLRLINYSLFEIIRMAYQLGGDQLVGGPDWIRTERFDVLAKAGAELPPMPAPPRFSSPAHPVFPMLRTLLDERTRLTVHHETRMLQKYALVMARADGGLGPRLRRSETTDCVALIASRRAAQQASSPGPPPQPGGAPPCGMLGLIGPPVRITADSQSMPQLTALLASFVGQEVVDRTGLTGLFSFTLETTQDLQTQPTAPAPANDVPSVFTAVQEQLGLKLESVREATDVLVIDHVERPMPD